MIAPYYQSKAVTLYKGDCRAGLREFAPESVALLLTDPPYGISVESDQFADADIEWDKGDPTELIDEMLAAARPAMKTNGELGKQAGREECEQENKKEAEK